MFPASAFIETNNVRLAIHERGSGHPVVLLHGFPELGYSWRFQLPALAKAGFRAIAPDLRGYGGSDKPELVSAYAMAELTADVVGLLDALQIDTATIVGHDWGALVAWQLALVCPERMSGLIALNIPFFPRPPFEPIGFMRESFGDDFYIVNFQDSHTADRACDADPGHVFDVMMRRRQITRERFNTLPKEMRNFSIVKALKRSDLLGESLLSPDDRKIYADAFAKGGFTPPINWYRNWTLNWESTADLAQQVDVPALFIGAIDDVIISPERIEAMRPCVTNLEIHMLENCGHWSQQEKPAEVNTLIIDWLSRQATTLI